MMPAPCVIHGDFVDFIFFLENFQKLEGTLSTPMPASRPSRLTNDSWVGPSPSTLTAPAPASVSHQQPLSFDFYFVSVD